MEWGHFVLKPGEFAISQPQATRKKSNKKKLEEEIRLDAEKAHCNTKKVWITLFACMVTRNINLELLHDNSCEAFIMALQRHSSENGRPYISYVITLFDMYAQRMNCGN